MISSGLRVLLILLLALAWGCGSEEPDPNYEGGNDFGPRIAVTCLHSVTNEADMIFRPTSKPPAHKHDVFGPERFENDLTASDLQGIPSTCKQDGDHSAWWRPGVYWNGEPLKPPTKLVIYLEITDGISAEKIRPFPVAFEDVSRSPSFRCGDGDWSAQAPSRCGGGSLEIRMIYDQCLDPTSDQVEANTAPARRSGCPESHPVLLPKIQSTGTYRLPGASGPLRVEGNSGIMDPSSMHEDFVNGWDQDVLKARVGLCLRQTGQQERRPEVCRTSDNR
jgi:Domain of unknown function (DUF1996)